MDGASRRTASGLKSAARWSGREATAPSMISLQAYNIILRALPYANCEDMAFLPRFCTNIGKKILAWKDVDMKLLDQVRQAWRDKHYLMSLQKNIIYAIFLL